MSRERTIQRGRRFHERTMTSTGIVERVTGTATNTATLQTDKTRETVFQGRCKIRLPAASAAISERDVLAQNLAYGEAILSLPVVADPATDTGNSGDVKKNDVVTVLTNPDDSAQVGASWRVKRSAIQSTATQRRFIVEAVE